MKYWGGWLRKGVGVTEYEWLTSENIVDMWAYLCPGRDTHAFKPLITRRQCRLFAMACLIIYAKDQWYDETWEEKGIPLMNDYVWAENWVYAGQKFGLPDGFDSRPALLREIVGNPFRPVEFKDEWRTPTVMKLANSFCSGCNGKGRYSYRGAEFGYTVEDCEDCRGTGRTDVIYGIMPQLGDALEDAGCEDEEILNHCRGLKRVLGKQGMLEVSCPVCGGPGKWRSGVGFENEKICMNTKAHTNSIVWEPGSYNDSPDRWEPSDCPHVRGCWVLEMILGENHA